MSERIHATSRYARLAKADAILVCVPTPSGQDRLHAAQHPQGDRQAPQACAERAEAIYGIVRYRTRRQDQPADALPLRAKVERALNDAGRPVKGSRIALLGVSYKPGVGDIRESHPLALPPGCYAPASPLLRRYLAGIGLFE
jgi:hypothetical protein